MKRLVKAWESYSYVFIRMKKSSAGKYFVKFVLYFEQITALCFKSMKVCLYEGRQIEKYAKKISTNLVLMPL